jgi:hypothetical protein
MSIAGLFYLARTLWKPLAVIAVVLAVYGAGYKKASRTCKAANLNAEIVELKRQAAASKSILAQTNGDESRRFSEIETLKQKVKAYEQAIKSRGNKDNCRAVPADDARRLRAIR